MLLGDAHAIARRWVETEAAAQPLDAALRRLVALRGRAPLVPARAATIVARS